MSAAIGPGDWVERVRGGNGLNAGSMWRVEDIDAAGGWCVACGPSAGSIGLLLHGIRHPSHKPWCSCGFRPIYRPKSEIIEALKAPVTRTPRPAKKSRETV